MPRACRDTSSSCHGTSTGSKKSQGISVGKSSSQEPCPSAVGTRQLGLIHKQTTQRNHCDCTGEWENELLQGEWATPSQLEHPGNCSDTNTARTREKEKPGPHSVPHILMPAIQSFLGAPHGGLATQPPPFLNLGTFLTNPAQSSCSRGKKTSHSKCQGPARAAAGAGA